MAGLVILVAFILIIITPYTSPTHQPTSLNLVFNHQQFYTDNSMKLSREFWSNSGLCPPAPINQSAQFYLSNDLLLNLQIIGSLPNRGLSHIRAHWIFELIDVLNTNFTQFDEFAEHLTFSNMFPTIEFMDGRISSHSWGNFTEEFLMHITTKYSLRNVSRWHFETWNEPDLKGYNILRWNGTQYEEYLNLVAKSIHRFGFKLRGPAGLFKKRKTHPFCWNVLSQCNRQPDSCPINEITFHRKGTTGDANEIVQGSTELIESILTEFPKLKNFKFSNSEADPIAGWSTPYEFHSDVRYAAITIANILLHLKEKYDGKLSGLQSISHDNSFLSYHPHEFNQRTLLARFQMNETNPRHVQFIQKPVYAALGMMANLGENLDKITEDKESNIIHMTTKSEYFVATIITTLNITTESKFVPIHLNVSASVNSYTIYIEFLEANRTDPAAIWKRLGSPSYPNHAVRRKMRETQYPAVYLIKTINKTFSAETNNDHQELIQIKLQSPFVVLIRICAPEIRTPLPPYNLRYRFIYKTDEVMLFWSETPLNQRCVKTYQIYFRSKKLRTWKCLTCRKHLPFLSHQHVVPKRGQSILGYYRVRAVDVFARKSQFSQILVIN